MIHGTAPCGMRYAVRRSGRAVAYCALSIGCGTRDETGYPAGIAHFVEHTLFRGTTRRSAASINGYLDRLGGELNAYTTKEEIVLHATVLKEDLPKAGRLLFELGTSATFPDADIATERGVVLDEIIQYKDNPAEDVYDQFEALLFQGTPLSTPILGTTASVKKITPAMLRSFVREKFIPSRMAFTVVADIEESRLERLVLKLIASAFEGVSSGVCGASDVGGFESAGELASLQEPSGGLALLHESSGGLALLYESSGELALLHESSGELALLHESSGELAPFHKVVDKRNHEVNAVMGGKAPSLHQMPDRLVAAMLCNILGGPASNSLLNKELREKRGWVYGIECAYTQYSDTGIAAISFGCDRANLEKCVSAIERILTRLCETPLSDAQVQAFRKQLLGQLAISSEAGEAQCLSMGKSLLSWGRIDSPEEVRAQIARISPSELQAMARRIFSPAALSSLVYL